MSSIFLQAVVSKPDHLEVASEQDPPPPMVSAVIPSHSGILHKAFSKFCGQCHCASAVECTLIPAINTWPTLGRHCQQLVNSQPTHVYRSTLNGMCAKISYFP